MTRRVAIVRYLHGARRLAGELLALDLVNEIREGARREVAAVESELKKLRWCDALDCGECLACARHESSISADAASSAIQDCEDMVLRMGLGPGATIEESHARLDALMFVEATTQGLKKRLLENVKKAQLADRTRTGGAVGYEGQVNMGTWILATLDGMKPSE
ncbi:hypothetical protein LCGC14_1808910, partial [marine sediment metagenome]